MTPARPAAAGMIDHTDAAVVRAEAERRKARKAAGLPFTADPDAVADDRAEVLRLATGAGARRQRCKAAASPDRRGKAKRGERRGPRPQNADKRVPSEHEEQAALIAKCDTWAKAYPELGMLYAIQNEMGIGGKGGRIIGAKRRAAGRRPGVPDLHLPVPRGGFASCYVELKRRTGGRVSPAQDAWHAKLRAHGHRVVVCRGADEAWAAITQYLGIAEATPAATAA